MNTKIILLKIASVCLFVGATVAAQAAEVVQDPSGNVAQILGLEFGGASYDAEFIYGRGNDIVGGPFDLDVNNQDEALAAGEAIAEVLNAESTAVNTAGQASETKEGFWYIPWQVSGANARSVKGTSDGSGGWTAAPATGGESQDDAVPYSGQADNLWVDFTIASESNANPLWPDADDLGSGWWNTWMGVLYDGTFPWIYHDTLDFLWVSGTEPSSVWLYSEVLGWLWTADGQYPYFYSSNTSDWYFYDVSSADPVWFYNFGTAAWESYQLGEPSNGKDILTFTLPEQTGPGNIDSLNHNVEIEVVNGTSLLDLTPTFTLSEGATSDPVSGTTDNYSSTVTITVTAGDVSTQDWEINVTEAEAVVSNEKDILTFTLPEQTGPGDIDNLAHNVKIEVAFGTSLLALTPTFTLSEGATSDPVSGTTDNYSSTVIIVVTAGDASTQDWEIIVTEAVGTGSKEKEILTFRLEDQTGPADIDKFTHNVNIEVKATANLLSLTPTFSVSPGATSVPPSGTTDDYSSKVTIRVRAT